MYTKAYLSSLANAIAVLEPFRERPDLLNVNEGTESGKANVGLHLV
jgi:hypothetical protein